MKEPVRLINTKAHALVDYALGAVLLLSPWIFDFRAGGPEYVVAAATGSVSIALAMLTRFEYALAPLIPLRAHLYFDILCGIALATSPWSLGFCPRVFKPHLVFGLTQVVVAALTDRVLHVTMKGS
jgi:hypothetical protein